LDAAAHFHRRAVSRPAGRNQRRAQRGPQRPAKRAGALLTQAARLDAETRNLIEHIKRYGPDADIAAQIKNARAKKDRTRVELDQLEQQMTARRIIVSDDALDWLAAHLRDEIRHAAPERVRAVIHSIIARIAMHTDDTLHIAYSVQSLLRQWSARTDRATARFTSVPRAVAHIPAMDRRPRNGGIANSAPAQRQTRGGGVCVKTRY